MRSALRSAALQVYPYARARGNGESMDAMMGEMGQRFARKLRKTRNPETTVKSGAAKVEQKA